jgi:hypothetical protein
MQQKLRLSILKEAKKLKKFKRNLLIQQKEEEQHLLNTVPSIDSTPGIVIKEEKPDIMEIELIDTANIIANSPTTSTTTIKRQDLNNTSLNINTHRLVKVILQFVENYLFKNSSFNLNVQRRIIL